MLISIEDVVMISKILIKLKLVLVKWIWL